MIGITIVLSNFTIVLSYSFKISELIKIPQRTDNQVCNVKILETDLEEVL